VGGGQVSSQEFLMKEERPARKRLRGPRLGGAGQGAGLGPPARADEGREATSLQAAPSSPGVLY
jgi:hypothetical protein